MKNTINLSRLSILICLMCSFLLMSCDNYSDIKNEIAKANAACPINSTGMSITSFEFDESRKTVVINCLVDENYMSVDQMSEHTDILKKWTILQAIKSSSSLQTFANRGLGIDYVYSSNKYKRKLTYGLTNKEIKDIVNGDYTIDGVKYTELNINELMLDNQIEISRTQLPTTIENGVVWKSINKDGGFVNFNYVCDERDYTVGQLQAAKGYLKNETLKGIESNDPSVRIFLQCCKWCKKEISYNYIGKQTGDTLKVILNSEDINTILEGNNY